MSKSRFPVSEFFGAHDKDIFSNIKVVSLWRNYIELMDKSE